MKDLQRGLWDGRKIIGFEGRGSVSGPATFDVWNLG